MFTGIVQDLGTVVSLQRRGTAAVLVVDTALLLGRMKDGDSVAVDGVCLTMSRRVGRRFHSDVVAETLSRTTLGRRGPGDRVNLECALGLGDPVGGHLVQGHVDAAVRVTRVTRKAGDWRVAIDLPASLRRYVSEKGSVSIQGVSLTVAGVSQTEFHVALIPETLRRTTLGGIRAGDRVNVEVDVLARYLEGLIRDSSHLTPPAPQRRGGKVARSRP